MSTRNVLVLALLVTSGCTTTQAVSVKEMQTISRGGHESAVVLRATDGTTVRIDPNTQIRFVHKDESKSYWFKARELEIGEHGVLGRHQNAQIPFGWEEIDQIEAKNLSGSKSLALVVGSAAVVAALVALAGDVKPASESVVVGVVAAPYHHHHVHHYYHGVHSAHCEHPDHHRRTATVSAPVNTAAREDIAARALFEGSVARRSSLELVPAFAAHAFLGSSNRGYGDAARYSVNAALTMRFSDMYEVGGGVQAASASGVVGFLRAGFNFYLEDDHRISVPVYADLGVGSEIAFQTRILFGARVRLVDTFTLGVYPVMPTFTRFRDADSSEMGTWSFPTAIEASFAF
jgi:hypothetical protein